jgi:hypothetical protein
MTNALALAELQQNLQALQSWIEADATTAIAQGLAFCQNFETHKQRYLPSTWVLAAIPQSTLATERSRLEMVSAGAPPEIHLGANSGTTSEKSSEENSEKNPEKNPELPPGNALGKTQEEKGKNAAKKGVATNDLSNDLSTAPVSTAPEEQMLSHYVELTKHMRLLAADFSMFRAARNPSTQKTRQHQVQQRLAMLLTYCQYLLAASA